MAGAVAAVSVGGEVDVGEDEAVAVEWAVAGPEQQAVVGEWES
jgi:hypothetical protein